MQAWKLQEETLRRLDAECASGRIHHTYLFEGRKGIGKKGLALEFAKRILCTADCKGHGGVCCDSCRKVDSGNHPDVMVIEPKEGKILAEDLKDYLKETVSPPFESKRKIFILHGFDLVAPEMQNMLLKSLEEPEIYVVNLLLACNTEKILPTILSRCSIFKLKPAKKEALQGYLEDRFQISSDRASYLATLSGGAFGCAEEICENVGFMDKKKEFLENFTSFLSGSKEKLIHLADMLEEAEDPILFLDMVLIFLRDVIALRCNVVSEIIDRESAPMYRSLSDTPLDRLEKSLSGVEEIKRHCKANVAIRNAWYAMM